MASGSRRVHAPPAMGDARAARYRPDRPSRRSSGHGAAWGRSDAARSRTVRAIAEHICGTLRGVSGRKYEKPAWASREELEATLAAGDDASSAQALVGLVFHDDDWRWCQNKCLELLGHHSPGLRRIAITCLGHVARIHGQMDVALVRSELQRLRDDPGARGAIEDAESDISIFIR